MAGLIYLDWTINQAECTSFSLGDLAAVVCLSAPEAKRVKLETCGQSYKAFTIVNYESRVVLYAIFLSVCMTLDS